MKCVSNDMQQDKNRATEFAVPIHGTLDQSRVKLLFREIVQVGSCASRIRSLAITRAAIVGQSSSYQPEKPMFCRLCTHPFSQVRMCTSCFQMEGWQNPEIGLCWSASGTVVTWCSKRSKRSCIVLCNSMIPDLVNMISLYRFATTFNNVRE